METLGGNPCSLRYWKLNAQAFLPMHHWACAEPPRSLQKREDEGLKAEVLPRCAVYCTGSQCARGLEDTPGREGGVFHGDSAPLAARGSYASPMMTKGMGPQSSAVNCSPREVAFVVFRLGLHACFKLPI